ncbi:ABC transporter permease [Urechidicola croceus]|uniref:ABC transporter permease n=1 Tax=Urechidicola croceus TaxID=1850246 RepID=A0A1D8PBG6_9FLAO|nr:ABC transporter permease [Urechidicola croceus]AOW21914.1 ABC transporter permease [Urechidicola croceus]
MDKLKLIIKREFIAKVRNKTFIVMTFLSPLLMIGMFTLVAYLTKSSLEKERVIAYVDASKLFTKDDFKDNKMISFIDLSDTDLETAKIITQENNYHGLLCIPSNKEVKKISENIQFYSDDSPNMIVISDLENIISKKLETEKMTSFGIDLEKLEAAHTSVDIKMSNFSGERTSKLINGLKAGIGIAAGYLIMMFVIIYGNMVMRSVIEEKTSRIIEVIISSVKPFQLMLGKVIGTASAGLLQFFIWTILLVLLVIIGSAVFGVDMSTNMQTQISVEQIESVKGSFGSEAQLILTEIWKLPLLSMFFLFIFYFLGGYLLYSSIYAAIGAAVDNETDTQQFMLPVILPLMLGVYIGFSSVIGDPHGTIATVFSMIPLTSPIVMLMRIPFGVPWWQILISMSLLIITFIGVIWFAAKIYRVGILMYGKKPTYKEIYKWLKY